MKKKAWEDIGVTDADLAAFDLPEKYKCFAYHYVMGSDKGRFNAGDAARKAGYSGRGGSADTTAGRMLKNVELKRFIGFITMQQLKPLKDKFRAEVVEKALSIICADIEDYINPNGTLAFTEWHEVDSRPVKNITQLSSGKFRVDLHDAREWTLILDKYMDLAEKADITVKVEHGADLKEATDQDLETYLASIAERNE